MNDERLPELFDEASGLDEEGRHRLLERLRGEVPELAEELARLLALPADAPSPIDVTPVLPAERDGDRDDVEGPPERVGPYRLLREIGKGGMGRVFLAEQATPDFSRTVALKLIDHPGPDTEAVRRFRDEVRILASLEHPWIARFLDGGRSPEGIWFLALEYVEGEDLVTHARDRDLDVAARVRLVTSVAEAVAYAHERGVVHRDIKPGNVLVGRDGRPRLLDFGISKLLDRGDPAGLTTTRHGVRPLTPAYASPEQLAGEAATPASDVYSLGVVLYELLAGRRPATDTTGGSTASEPEPPSTAARRAPAPAGRPASTDPSTGRRARRRISRDLDAICLKALRREPRDRYAQAAGLVADLKRVLDGEPVEARRGERRYRLRRFLRRRAAALAIVALALAVGLAAGLVRFVRTPPGDSPVVVPRASSGKFPFDPVNPPAIEESERRFAESPDDFVAGAALALALAREKRFDESRLVLGRLRQIPQPEPEPIVDFVEGRVAALAGEDQRALVHYTRALEQAVAERRTDLVPTIRQARGALLAVLGQRDAGRAELELARDEAERAGESIVLFRALNELAVDRFQQGQFTEGEAALDRALAAAREAGLTPIIVLSNLAEVRLLLGRPDLAEPLAREALEQRQRFPSVHREGEELTRLALILRDLGRSDEAEPPLERALTLLRGSSNAMSRAAAIYARAQADLESGRPGGLEALAAELEAAARESLRRRPLGFAHLVRAGLDDTRGERAAARTHFAEARRLFALEGDGDLAALASLLAAESALAAGESAAAAEALAEEPAALSPAAATAPARVACTIRARLAAAAGDAAAARDHLAALGAEVERSPSVRLRLAFLAARAQVAEGDAAARADLETALALAQATGRKPVELELRLALAHRTDAATAATAIDEVAREAEALGLAALAERARRRGAEAP